MGRRAYVTGLPRVNSRTVSAMSMSVMGTPSLGRALPVGVRVQWVMLFKPAEAGRLRPKPSRSCSTKVSGHAATGMSTAGSA